MVQEPPFCIQIELTLGCNLKCTFCGINGIGYGHSEKGYKYMSIETATATAKKIGESGWNPRLEFARRGEPTLNPHLYQIMGIFNDYSPTLQKMVTTNGAGLLKGKDKIGNIVRLFKNGLNILAIDDYQDYKLGQKLRAVISQNAKGLSQAGIGCYEYPKQPEGNPHKRHKKGAKLISILYDISRAEAGTHSVINNHAGYAGKAREYMKPCAKPFREMSVDYNGNITKCCITWGGEYVMASIEQPPTLEQVWNNQNFYAVRQKLMRGERDFGLCQGCDHPSYRVGLLPDKMGQRKSMYPPPDERTYAILDQLEQQGYQESPNQYYHENMAGTPVERGKNGS